MFATPDPSSVAALLVEELGDGTSPEELDVLVDFFVTVRQLTADAGRPAPDERLQRLFASASLAALTSADAVTTSEHDLVAAELLNGEPPFGQVSDNTAAPVVRIWGQAERPGLFERIKESFESVRLWHTAAGLALLALLFLAIDLDSNISSLFDSDSVVATDSADDSEGGVVEEDGLSSTSVSVENSSDRRRALVPEVGTGPENEVVESGPAPTGTDSTGDEQNRRTTTNDSTTSTDPETDIPTTVLTNSSTSPTTALDISSTTSPTSTTSATSTTRRSTTSTARPTSTSRPVTTQPVTTTIPTTSVTQPPTTEAPTTTTSLVPVYLFTGFWYYVPEDIGPGAYVATTGGRCTTHVSTRDGVFVWDFLPGDLVQILLYWGDQIYLEVGCPSWFVYESE